MDRSDKHRDAKSKLKDRAGDATPKKRRKVNHACVYCRRSHMTCDLERPCTRCIKRNIAHLCHDEPREADHKQQQAQTPFRAGMSESDTKPELAPSMLQASLTSMGPPSAFNPRLDGGANQGTTAFAPSVLGQGNPLQFVQQRRLAGLQGNNALNSSNMNQFAGFSDAWLTAQNQLYELDNYHPNYMVAPEVTDEFNLLDNFLHTSLLDDGAHTPDTSQSSPVFSRSSQGDMLPNVASSAAGVAGGTRATTVDQEPQALLLPAEQGKSISRPSSAAGGDKDKAREYYLQAADPSGNDTPEERMQRVLKAKYDAGLLKPFNHLKGYTRLSGYLDGHIAPTSKQKILRTLDRFRPKFREKAQALTDMELVYVEMWFEQQLMEYDRVFASMAVPACLWRRTGEIYRGNKEMAELIHVPVERLRDGNIALHEILTEDSLVRYWEEFGTIAFDPDHDTLLTACALKNPDDNAKQTKVKCAFSFRIQRDNHKMPTIIVGNFLPHDPPPPQ